MKAATLLLALTVAANGQLSPKDAANSFQLADRALRVELVAAEPMVESPCAIAFDDKGRLFVAENRGYPNTAEPPQGRIALLTDADGDGEMDARTTFADGLTFPNGVLPWRDGLIVTCAPDVLFLRDTDGDGRADERKVLFTGFDTKGSTQLRVNAPTLGPDGWIYLAAGLSGGSITCPSHPDRPTLKMTSDVRFHPDSLEIENVDGRSQYGMSFDEAGRRFICMNRIQVQHVVLSSKLLGRNPHLAFSDTVQNCPELVPNGLMRSTAGAARLYPISSNITTADSHQGFFSAACAVTIWRGGALPETYRGCALSCDPTGNLIHADRLKPHGLTFAAVPMFEGKEFLASSNDWFRPVFLAHGPDGALYIADMTRKVIEHPDYLPGEVRKQTDFESGKSMGRIWRVKASAADTAAREAKPLPKPDLLQEIIRAGESASAASLRDLAVLLVKHRSDRWIRAAVLSGIAGHEIEFLREFLAELEAVDEGAEEIFLSAGRMFPSVPALEKALSGADLPAPLDPKETRFALTALVLGATERSREPIDATEKEIWRNAILTRAVDCAQDTALSASHRQIAIRLLGRMTWSKAGEPLSRLAAGEADESLRFAAMRAYAGFSEPEVVRTLLVQGAWGKRTPAQRETILAALLANPAHLGGVLDAIEAGALPRNAVPAIRRAAFLKAKDETVRGRAEKLFQSPAGNQQAAFEKAKAALELRPDAAAGREVFHAFCSSCHRLEREGHAVGPDLFDIRGQTKENILFHIVAPDAEIAPAFTAYSVETKAGRSLAGLLTSESASSLTVRMPLAQEETLSRSDVAKIEALPSSLMPAGLEAMGAQSLADLLAFLKGEAAP